MPAFAADGRQVQVTRPYAQPSDDFASNHLKTDTTDAVLAAAAGAGLCNFLTGLQFKNTSAVASELVVKDGSTVLWRGHVGASMTAMEAVTFPTPLKSSPNTALNAALLTTATSTYINGQGYKAPPGSLP
jgi:hypothetical protein